MLRRHQPVWVRQGSQSAADVPFVAGVVTEVRSSADEVSVRASGGSVLRVRRSDVFAANAEASKPPDDHCALVHLNEPCLLHSTIARTEAERVYTWVGASQLLSVNPCRQVDGLFGEAVMEHFRGRAREVGETAPHAYAVAEAACVRLRRQHRVAVLVSGESGSGKTEASRLIVQYLVWRASQGGETASAPRAAAAKAHAASIREGVLASNTVLEAFGNARMVANSNSSRFGKHTLLHVAPPTDPDAPITLRGATVECFLLEKCRLCAFAPGERNFHALYYLLAGTRPGGWSRVATNSHPSSLLADASASAPREYTYLRSSAERAAAAGIAPAAAALAGAPGAAESAPAEPGGGSSAAASCDEEVAVADHGYKVLLAALRQLGMETKAHDALFRILRAVLILGQLDLRLPQSAVRAPLDAPKPPPSRACAAKRRPPSSPAAKPAPSTLPAAERPPPEPLLAPGSPLRPQAHPSPPGSPLTLAPPQDPRDLAALTQVLGEDALPVLLGATIASPRSGSVLTRAYTADQAHTARDALAQALYAASFDAIVGFINAQLAPAAPGAVAGSAASEQPERGIALLDIFGFEVLRVNSLEQLLINYTNEKLHQHFLRCTVREEERVQLSEGLPPLLATAGTGTGTGTGDADSDGDGTLSIDDNERLISLLERKGAGLYACLESCTRVEMGNDAIFMRDLFDQNGEAVAAGLLRHPHSSAMRGARKLARGEGFQLAHFHSSVQYDASGFVAKNRDALSAGLAAVVDRQISRLRTDLATEHTPPLPPPPPPPVGTPAGLRGGRAKSLSEGHRLRLAELLGSLDPAAGVHNFFIKCVKPNRRMEPRRAESGYVLCQLRQLGVLQAVMLIKQGFPHRIAYDELHDRYAPLLREMAASTTDSTTAPSTAPSTAPTTAQLSLKTSQVKPSQLSLPRLAAVEPRGLVEAILAAEGLVESTDYVLGRTRVFLRLGRAQLLERMLTLPPAEVLMHIHTLSLSLSLSHTHTHAYTCAYTYIHMCIHAHTHTCIHTCAYTHVRTYTLPPAEVLARRSHAMPPPPPSLAWMHAVH